MSQSESPTQKQDLITVPDWNAVKPEKNTAAELSEGYFGYKGKSANVVRSNGDIDGGWTVVDDEAHMKIGEENGFSQYVPAAVLEKTVGDEILQKTVSLTELLRLNPELVESEPNTQVIEDLGATTLEAVGLTEPSIDDARMMTLEERRAARTSAEAAKPEVVAETGKAPREALLELIDGLSAKDVESLRDYAHAVEDVEEIRALALRIAGEPDRQVKQRLMFEHPNVDTDYIRAKQAKGQAHLAMSPAAQNVQNTFTHLYKQTRK